MHLTPTRSNHFGTFQKLPGTTQPNFRQTRSFGIHNSRIFGILAIMTPAADNHGELQIIAFLLGIRDHGDASEYLLRRWRCFILSIVMSFVGSSLYWRSYSFNCWSLLATEFHIFSFHLQRNFNILVRGYEFSVTVLIDGIVALCLWF